MSCGCEHVYVLPTGVHADSCVVEVARKASQEYIDMLEAAVNSPDAEVDADRLVVLCDRVAEYPPLASLMLITAVNIRLKATPP